MALSATEAAGATPPPPPAPEEAERQYRLAEAYAAYAVVSEAGSRPFRTADDVTLFGAARRVPLQVLTMFGDQCGAERECKRRGVPVCEALSTTLKAVATGMAVAEVWRQPPRASRVSPQVHRLAPPAARGRGAAPGREPRGRADGAGRLRGAAGGAQARALRVRPPAGAHGGRKSDSLRSYRCLLQGRTLGWGGRPRAVSLQVVLQRTS